MKLVSSTIILQMMEVRPTDVKLPERAQQVSKTMKSQFEPRSLTPKPRFLLHLGFVIQDTPSSLPNPNQCLQNASG